MMPSGATKVRQTSGRPSAHEVQVRKSVTDPILQQVDALITQYMPNASEQDRNAILSNVDTSTLWGGFPATNGVNSRFNPALILAQASGVAVKKGLVDPSLKFSTNENFETIKQGFADQSLKLEKWQRDRNNTSESYFGDLSVLSPLLALTPLAPLVGFDNFNQGLEQENPLKAIGGAALVYGGLTGTAPTLDDVKDFASNPMEKINGLLDGKTTASLDVNQVGALADTAGASLGGTNEVIGSGLLGSGAIEGAAGVTEGLGASMAANGAAVANSTLAALPQAGFTIGEGLAAGAAGGAAASGGFGQLAGSSVGEAFGAGAAPEMGSGLLGQSGALAQGAAGTGYVAPFTSGSITGAAGMPAIGAGALGDIAATTGMSTAGLGAAGGALTAPVADGFKTGINSWQDALNADAAEMAKPQTDWFDKAKDAKRLYDTAKGLMDKGQPQGQEGGLLDAGGVRQFSPLEVSYLPKLQSYGLLNGPQSLLGF